MLWNRKTLKSRSQIYFHMCLKVCKHDYVWVLMCGRTYCIVSLKMRTACITSRVIRHTVCADRTKFRTACAPRVTCHRNIQKPTMYIIPKHIY